jgi:deoxyribose-phosphate aldolase
MDHAAPAPPPTYDDLASLTEYLLTRTDLSESDIAEGCEAAKRVGAACVVVRPSDLDLAARWIAGSRVTLGTIIDTPYGYSTTAVKIYATSDALRRGAREIDTTLNTSKMISRQFQYLESEILQVAEACHRAGALLKVGLESAHLNDELKIVACRIAKRAGADFIASPEAADIPLLREYSRGALRIKASDVGGDFSAALALREAGCARIASAHAPALLESWKAKLESAQTAAPESAS